MVELSNRILIWLKSAYTRVTFTKTTLAFFLFTFAYCFSHALVQSLLFELDSDAQAFSSMIISAADVPSKEFAWLSQTYDKATNSELFTLKVCNAIPFEKRSEEDPCVTVFQSNVPDESSIPIGFKRRQLSLPGSNTTTSSDDSDGEDGPPLNINKAFIQPVVDPLTNIVSTVDLTNPNINGGELVSLSSQCTRALLYADQVLRNSKREEIALIGSEFWLLWTSTMAIMYGSIAHLFATLAFRLLSVGWSAYSIWRTYDIRRRFNVLLTEGACEVDLFPDYFRPRISIQIADLVLNFLALLLLSYLVARLVRTYKTFMFRCVGPPDHVVKIYGFVLGLFTCLQVSIYLLITSAALWLDQLLNGAIASISSHTSVYLGVFITTLILLIPWTVIGGRSVRLEQRRWLIAFVFLGLLFEAGWSGMYDSLVWRWTWIQWPFFASVAVASQVVLVASVVLGVICRLNFGKGLKEYLHAASALEAEDFEPEIFERDDRNSSSFADDGWEADLEKKLAADRLSQTLDFGAHQPAPPLSPLAYNTPWITTPTPASLSSSPRVRPPTDVPSLQQTARPESFSGITSTLPTLGKNAHWESLEQDANEGAYPGPRL